LLFDLNRPVSHVGNYSIVRLQGIGYQEAIEATYSEAPLLADKPYPQQLETILSKKLSHAGGFVKAMASLGNEATEILYDCEPLQLAWARERGIPTHGKNWQTNILLEQLREISPDVVLFQDIFSMPAAMRARIKDLVPGIRLTIIAKGYPGETRDLSDSDLLFVSSPVLLDRYAQLNPFLVYHAFDDDILTTLDDIDFGPMATRYQFSFLGNCRAPERRYWMLKKLLEETELQIWGVEENVKYSRWGIPKNQKQLKKIARDGLKYLLSRLGSYSLHALEKFPISRKIHNLIDEINGEGQKVDDRSSLTGLDTEGVAKKTLRQTYPERFHDPIFGIQYYHRVSNSDVVFNLHSDAAGMTVDNMKMFEITGVGSCLLTNMGSNLGDLFELDKEVVTYETVGEALEKYQYLKENPSTRVEIARAGQIRTLRDHTVSARCEQMNEIIQERL